MAWNANATYAQAAKRQVSAVLGMTLERGYEDFHWIAPTTVVEIDEIPRAVAQSEAGRRRARECAEGSRSNFAEMESGNMYDTSDNVPKRVKYS